MISEITQGNDVLGSFKLIDLVSESNEQLVQCGEMFSVSSVGVQDHSEASGMSEESEKKSAVFTPTKKPLSRFHSHQHTSRVSSRPQQPQHQSPF